MSFSPDVVILAIVGIFSLSLVAILAIFFSDKRRGEALVAFVREFVSVFRKRGGSG